MPQASDEERAWAIGRFGDIGTDGPIQFLEESGYRLRKDYWWDAPGWEPTAEEIRAIDFLVWEWDFGWIADGG